MKNIFLLLFLYTDVAYAQNVGIGTINPTRAKLEVHGVAGAGATNAIFSAPGNAGISLQQNWPTIGFNQYRDLITPGSHGKRMTGGYASLWTFDHNSGNMAIDMYGTGAAESFTGAGNLAWHFNNSGNMGIRNAASASASLWVSRIASNTSAVAISGTTHTSHFMYSANQDTYIRGGLDGSKVVINDIPKGRVNIGLAGNFSSTLNVRGSVAHTSVRTTATSYVLGDNDYEIFCDMQNTVSKIINIVLPAPSAEREGRVYRIVAVNLPKIDGASQMASGYVGISGDMGDNYVYDYINYASAHRHRLFYAEQFNVIGADYRWIRTAVTYICVSGKWLKLHDNESFDSDDIF
jgi:hypothetical protein